jgi:hypothetical protein
VLGTRFDLTIFASAVYKAAAPEVAFPQKKPYFAVKSRSEDALKRPAFQKNAVKGDQSNEDDNHRYHDRDGDHILLL